jgi:hypothetical protein
VRPLTATPLVIVVIVILLVIIIVMIIIPIVMVIILVIIILVVEVVVVVVIIIIILILITRVIITIIIILVLVVVIVIVMSEAWIKNGLQHVFFVFFLVFVFFVFLFYRFCIPLTLPEPLLAWPSLHCPATLRCVELEVLVHVLDLQVGEGVVQRVVVEMVHVLLRRQRAPFPPGHRYPMVAVAANFEVSSVA